MFWTPISNTVPQYEEDGVAASGFYIKFYLAGTTTPTAMATDSSGVTLLDKCELNTEGYPKNGSNAVFIPHIDRSYKIALFRNSEDADNNNFNNAAWVVDNLSQYLVDSLIGVDNVTALRALTGLTDGQVIYLKGHTQIGVGGGELIVLRDSIPSDTDDGGYRFVVNGKLIERQTDFVTLNMMGGFGDWDGSQGTDNAGALSRAIDTGLKVIVGNPGERYLVASEVAKTNTSIDINLNGAEIIQRGDYTPLAVTQDFTEVQNVSSIGTAEVDLRNGDAGSTTTVSTLAVQNGSAYTKDDIIKIVSEDIIPATDPADNEKLGEFAKVSEVNGNVLSLFSLLRESYSTGIRVGKMSDQYDVKIYGGKFNADNSVNPTWSFPLITLTGCFEPAVSVSADRTRAELLELISCLGARTYAMSAKTQITSIANTAFGYTIVEYGCEGGTHVEPKAYDCRHVYTTGGLGAADITADISRYGSTRDFVVSNGYGFNCQIAAFDTHPDARGGKFIGCTAVSPYNGPSGTQQNYQLRGIGGKIEACSSIGGTGYRVSSEVDHEDAARGNVITDSSHRSLPTEQNFRYPFRVTSISSRKVKGVKIVNPVIEVLTGRWSQFRIESGDVDIINPLVNAALTGTGDSDTIYADNGSVVKVQGGIFNYEDATDSNIRVANIQDSNSSVELHGTEIRSEMSVYMARFNNMNGTFIAKRCRLNNGLLRTSGSADFGVSNVGVNSTYLIDYDVDNNLNVNPAIIETTFNAAGEKSLSLFGMGHDLIQHVLTLNAASARVTEISPGYFRGQKLSLRVSTSSPNSVSIETGTNIDIGSNETVNIGKSLLLAWDGTNWSSL